jgi:hypothetical protein
MEGGYAVSNIYMEGLYKQYQKGESLDSLLKLVAEIYTGNRVDEFYDIERWMADYENVRDNLVLQAVNKNRNSALLKTVPHREIKNTDLAVVYQVFLDTSLMGGVMIAVKNANARMWGTDRESLYQTALNNTVHVSPPRVNAMSDIILGSQEDKIKNLFPLSDFTERPNEVYVLTNNRFSHGAAVMLYPGVLQFLAEKCEGSLYIIPSSIHEILFMKDNGNMSGGGLRVMLTSVNHGSLEPEEVLSDEVYYYNKEEKILTNTASDIKYPANFG